MNKHELVAAHARLNLPANRAEPILLTEENMQEILGFIIQAEGMVTDKVACAQANVSYTDFLRHRMQGQCPEFHDLIQSIRDGVMESASQDVVTMALKALHDDAMDYDRIKALDKVSQIIIRHKGLPKEEKNAKTPKGIHGEIAQPFAGESGEESESDALAEDEAAPSVLGRKPRPGGYDPLAPPTEH